MPTTPEMVSNVELLGTARTRHFMRKSSVVVMCALMGWSVAVVGGTLELWRYAMKPGDHHRPAAILPAALRVPTSNEQFTLVMVAHPRCPCTRASMQELAKIMTHVTQPLRALVLVCRPPGASNGFEQGDLWKQASVIPGVNVQIDLDGQTAIELGLFVSGTVSVFDPTGKLVFSGGITAARGHEGDNAGADAVIQILSGSHNEVTRTPVYGCSLFAPGDCSTTGDSEVRPCCE